VSIPKPKVLYLNKAKSPHLNREGSFNRVQGATIAANRFVAIGDGGGEEQVSQKTLQDVRLFVTKAPAAFADV
jgi:hypothetical protein